MIGPLFFSNRVLAKKTTKHFVCASDGAIGKPHGVGKSPPKKKQITCWLKYLKNIYDI